MNPLEMRAHRLALGMTQAALAALLDVKQNTVSRWENGAAPIPAGVANDLSDLGKRLDDLADACTAQGRGEGVITVVDDPGKPLSALLLVAAANAQRTLAAGGVTAPITAAD